MYTYINIKNAVAKPALVPTFHGKINKLKKNNKKKSESYSLLVSFSKNK